MELHSVGCKHTFLSVAWISDAVLAGSRILILRALLYPPPLLLVKNTRRLFTPKRGRKQNQTSPQPILQFQLLSLLSLPPTSLLQRVQDIHVHCPTEVPVSSTQPSGVL